MKYRGILSIVGLILQGLLAFSPGGAAWAQSESGNEIGEGAAETPQLRPGSLCAILIGIDDPALANRARLTAQSDVESIGQAVERLAAAAGKPATTATVLAKDATRDGIDEAVAKCAGSPGDSEFRLLFFVGSLSSMPPPDDGKWQLTVAPDESAESAAPAPGIPLDELPSVFGSLSGHPGLIVFDVYVDPDSGDADTAAKALAAALGNTGLPTLVLAATQVDALESPTASDSHVGRALSTALTSRLADEVPYGDSDGRISLWEIARYIMGHTERQWGETVPAPQVALFEQARIRENHLVLAVRPQRLASIDEWKSQLSRFTDEKSLGPRLVMEARRALDGEHGLETLPEDRRAELIDLVRRLAVGEIAADDYVLQRSILLGTPAAPSAEAGGSGAGEATGLWGNMSGIVKILLLVGVVGILVYLIARALLMRGPAPAAEESLPVMADDFLASGQTSGQTATKKTGAGKGQDPKRAKTGTPSAIRSIRPVGSPLQGPGAQSPPKGVTPPSPSRGTPGAATDQRGAAGAAKPTEGEDETFENIDRPPSIAELRARSAKKGGLGGKKDPTATDETSEDTEGFEGQEVEFDLDLEAAGEDETRVPGFGPVGSPIAGGAPAGSPRVSASHTPREIDLESVEAPTPRANPALAAPQAIRPLAAAGSPATPLPVKNPPTRQTTPSPLNPPSARIELGGAPISPGVLPAVIRAWDLEWTGPMARARFRIFMGQHLEMGRPARARDGEEAELMISLLPVGEDRKPNAALIAMLSRKAFAIDLSLDGIRVTVLNKASAHVSPDPLRPYWDWDNPMPGTERLIPPSETLWVSPHFGKTLAPISMKGLSTAGEVLCPCAMEMHFDATFHDQVGITVLLVPEDFVMLWGADEAAQILPNVGEGPALWLRAHATDQGLTITPLEGGKWSRRQGRMIDEQTLLLGGVSSVEWKTDRGEMSLKLTPHALPRLGTTAPKSGA